MLELRRWPNDIADEEILAEYEKRVNRAKNIREEVVASNKRNRPLWSAMIYCIVLLLALAGAIAIAADMIPNWGSMTKTLLLALFAVGYVWLVFIEPTLERKRNEKQFKQDYPKEHALLSRKS